ncbi:hypothetical protein P3L10_028728 [Capsicum annuum]
MIDKEENREEELKNKHRPDIKDLSDEHMTDKEEGHDEELKKHHNPNMEDLSDDVGDKITNLVQDAIDALLFDLSTPSTTNSLDVGAPNTVNESQWTIFDSHFSPDFLDAQVREREVTKAPVKRDRKN